MKALAECSCGRKFFEIPKDAGANELGSMVFRTFECPTCRSGVTTVEYDGKPCSDAEAGLFFYADTGAVVR